LIKNSFLCASAVSSFLDQEIPREPEVIELFKKLVGAGPLPPHWSPGGGVLVWDNMEQLQAWRNSADFKEARKIGDKYAKFRSFAIEDPPQ
jgi:alpha-glucosidase (family GH31 glycosyl hydrolase)